MKLKHSILINIILLLAITFVVLKSDFYDNLIYKFSNKASAEDSYQNRWEYKHNTDLYKLYNKPANIVMLGNSITYRVDWNELLNRTDIANRGIGNDITLGMLNRLQDVYDVNPKVCFVMGGINDIMNDIEPEKIVLNIEAICNDLKEKNIKPIVYSIIYTSKKYPNHKNINNIILQTNSLLELGCFNNNITFVDINTTLSDNYSLKQEFSFDGVHLSAQGYKIWKELINPIIKQEIDN